MNSERWSQIQALFDSALEQDPPKRVTFLKAACKDDIDLYNEVASLLSSDQQINSLIDGQALDAITVSDNVLKETSREGEVIGSYKLIKKIGQGGMGIVYLAARADGQFEQQVALKLIKRGMDSELIVRRFLSERQILARLDHPNIARLIDGGMSDDGLPYFAMEYIEGIPLIPYCNARKLDIQERLALFDQICETVHYAHRNLVVHRDLKPGNILVTQQGKVKLLDFGIARVLSKDERNTSTVLTQAGQRVLTPEYAAPEQITGDPITTQTDVYSLGVILYELLTGRRPLKITSHSPVEVEMIVRNEVPIKPSNSAKSNDSLQDTHATPADKIRRTLVGDLDTICLKSLQKDPVRRYSSANEFRLDIDRYLKGLPVSAQPDTVRYRAQKFLKRQRAGVITALLFLLIISTVVALYTFRLNEARQQAQQEALKAEQTSVFLTSLFEASNPLVAKGDTLNARHMLEAGAARIEEDLADQPAVQASIFTVIGDAYNGLGLYLKAEENFEHALDLTEKTSGRNNPEAALLLQRMADIRHSLSDFPVADSLERATLSIQKALFGEEHPAIAATLLKMASTNRSMGNYDEAIPLYEQAVAMNEKLLPKDDPELSWSINNLGWAYYTQGRYEEAEAAYQKAEEIQRTYLGEEHSDLAYTLNNYGGLLWSTGNFEEGEPKVRESLKIRRGLYGEEHPETMQSLNNLATLLFRKGEIEASEPLYRQILETNRRLLGEKHRYVASTLSSLGSVMRETGRLEEAEKLQLEALAIRTELFGDDHRQVAFSRNNLAAVYRLKGNAEQAVTQYEQALNYWRSVDKQPVDMAFPLLGLGRSLLDQGKVDEAEPYINEALALRKIHFDEDDLLVAEVKAALGRCFFLQGNSDEAKTLLSEAHRTFTSHDKQEDRRALEIDQWLREMS